MATPAEILSHSAQAWWGALSSWANADLAEVAAPYDNAIANDGFASEVLRLAEALTGCMFVRQPEMVGAFKEFIASLLVGKGSYPSNIFGYPTLSGQYYVARAPLTVPASMVGHMYWSRWNALPTAPLPAYSVAAAPVWQPVVYRSAYVYAGPAIDTAGCLEITTRCWPYWQPIIDAIMLSDGGAVGEGYFLWYYNRVEIWAGGLDYYAPEQTYQLIGYPSGPFVPGTKAVVYYVDHAPLYNPYVYGDWHFRPPVKAALQAYVSSPPYSAPSEAELAAALDGNVFLGYGEGTWANLLTRMGA